jgi:hypothetical protein
MLAPSPPELQQLLGAVAGNREAMEGRASRGRRDLEGRLLLGRERGSDLRGRGLIYLARS